MEKEKEFGTIRSKLWPIHNHELKKFLPMFSIFFCISFIYSMLRNTKNIFVMSKAASESMSLVKILGVLPAAFIFTAIYDNLVGRMKRDKVFNLVVVFFLSFFAFFSFVLAPNLESLKLTDFASKMNEDFPSLMGLWAAIENWPFILYYVMSELWGTFALSVLFWTFANQITSSNEAKRFYGFLTIGANIGLFVAGMALKKYKKDLMAIVSLVLIVGILLLIIHTFFVSKINSNPEEYLPQQVIKKKKKVKLTYWQSLKVLSQSKHLRLISLLVISYGVTINLVETIWAGEADIYAKSLGVSKDELFSGLYANQSMATAIVTIIMVLLLSSAAVERGWKFTALITPVSSIIMAGSFFIVLFLGKYLSFVTVALGMTSLYLAIVIGIMQIVFIKSAKYAFFDPTKERAYLPLDHDLKTQGKAAVDGIGGRLGKSLGAVIVQLFLALGSSDGKIGSVKHFFVPIVIVTLVVWIYSASELSRELHILELKSREE